MSGIPIRRKLNVSKDSPGSDRSGDHCARCEKDDHPSPRKVQREHSPRPGSCSHSSAGIPPENSLPHLKRLDSGCSTTVIPTEWHGHCMDETFAVGSVDEHGADDCTRSVCSTGGVKMADEIVMRHFSCKGQTEAVPFAMKGSFEVASTPGVANSPLLRHRLAQFSEDLENVRIVRRIPSLKNIPKGETGAHCMHAVSTMPVQNPSFWGGTSVDYAALEARPLQCSAMDSGGVYEIVSLGLVDENLACALQGSDVEQAADSRNRMRTREDSQSLDCRSHEGIDQIESLEKCQDLLQEKLKQFGAMLTEVKSKHAAGNKPQLSQMKAALPQMSAPFPRTNPPFPRMNVPLPQMKAYSGVCCEPKGPSGSQAAISSNRNDLVTASSPWENMDSNGSPCVEGEHVVRCLKIPRRVLNSTIKPRRKQVDLPPTPFSPIRKAGAMLISGTDAVNGCREDDSDYTSIMPPSHADHVELSAEVSPGCVCRHPNLKESSVPRLDFEETDEESSKTPSCHSPSLSMLSPVAKLKRLEELREDLLSRNEKLQKEVCRWTEKSLCAEERCRQAYQRCKELEEEQDRLEEKFMKSQEMLEKSLNVRHETEECLRRLSKKEIECDRQLGRVQKENDSLRMELEALKAISLENDERVRYYQKRENELQDCLDKAISQISELEGEAKMKSLQDKRHLHKLLEEHEALHKEHQTVKILYADALRRVEESMKEISSLKISLEHAANECEDLRLENDELSRASTKVKEMNLNSPSSVRSSPFGSPCKLSSSPSRKTWCADHVAPDKFQPPPDTSPSDNENSRCRSRIPQHENRRARSSSASSTFSETTQAMFGSVNRQVGLSDFRSRDARLMESALACGNPKQIKPATKVRSWFIPTEDCNKIVAETQEKIYERPEKEKDAICENSAIRRHTDTVSASAVVTPRVTTEEVLEAVMEGASEMSQAPEQKPSRNPITHQLDEYRIGRQPLDSNVTALEGRLAKLTAEKCQLETRFGRLPSRNSSNRNSRRRIDDENKLENRYEEVVKEMGKVRMALRKCKAL